jgi:hypothetical protein
MARILLAGEGAGHANANGGAVAEGVDMTVVIEMQRTLRDNALSDLRRPHAYAAERIGFLYGRLASKDVPLIVITRYVPVADEHYVNDYTVGARISGDAIRGAMQEVLETGDGVFHTHLHEWPGVPGFSRTDEDELPKLIPAFRAVGPNQPTGLFLFSPDSALVAVWLPHTKAAEYTAQVRITS